LPSPVKSAAATLTPPLKPGVKAKKSASTAPDTPLNTRTRGPPPWPAATIRSGRRSPSTSAAATSTPPVKVVS
jgi:hypothetical protein